MRPRRPALAVLALLAAVAGTACSGSHPAATATTAAPTVSATSFDPQAPDVYRSTEPIRNRYYPFLIQAVPGLPDGTIIVRTQAGAALDALESKAARLPGVQSVERSGGELRLRTNGPTLQTMTDDVSAMQRSAGVRQVVVVMAYADPSISPMP